MDRPSGYHHWMPIRQGADNAAFASAPPAQLSPRRSEYITDAHVARMDIADKMWHVFRLSLPKVPGQTNNQRILGRVNALTVYPQPRLHL
jgi:hypothetical protein